MKIIDSERASAIVIDSEIDKALSEVLTRYGRYLLQPNCYYPQGYAIQDIKKILEITNPGG